MELFNSLRKAVGLKTTEERMLETSPEKRAKLAAKALKNENKPENSEVLRTIKESQRIFEMSNATPAQKIRLPEMRDLKYKDGTVWLNLVLALYEKANKDQQPSILIENPDLAIDVRQVLAKEMAHRDSMPPVKQRMLDAAHLMIIQKAIFNLEPPKAAHDSDPTGMDEAA